MPHKHRLAPSSKRASNYDLPPSTLAQPLPVTKTKAKPTSSNPNSASKPAPKNGPSTGSRKRKAPPSDTPRAFTRLLATHHPTPRSGLDDGAPPPSKRRKSSPPPPPPAEPTLPSILPHESLHDYNARVDTLLPVAGLGKRRGPGLGADVKLEKRTTKTERKMQRMYREWRAEEARRRARQEEMDSEVDSEGEDGVGKKNGKRRSGKGDNDGDIWAAVAAKRRDAAAEQGGGAGLVGLHDVVLAPPKLGRAPRETFKVKDGGGGIGLKRRAELSEARERVVEGYRALMRGKGAGG